jgi:hypothetical protein
MIKTVLSIDWDFFFYRGCEVESAGYITIPTGEKMPLSMFFDWGHGEQQSEALQDILWSVRFQHFKRAGLDPYQITRKNCVAPSDFYSDVKKRLGGSRYDVNYSDSHRHAYYTVDDAYHDNDCEPLHVLHFDAHHDLGYSLKTIKQHRKDKTYDCADWLFAALDSGIVGSVEVVYPDWRGLHEFKNSETRQVEDYSVKFTTWKDWTHDTARYDVEAVHIARSGTWVPPWFDKDFDRFVHWWGGDASCFDCITEMEGLHACTVRPWEDPQEEVFPTLISADK